MVEVVVTTGAVKSCKATVKWSPPTKQHPAFLQAGCPSCRPTNSVKSLKGKYNIPWTCLPQTHGSSNFVFDHALIAPGYLGEVLSCLSSPSDANTPRPTIVCRIVFRLIIIIICISIIWQLLILFNYRCYCRWWFWQSAVNLCETFPQTNFIDIYDTLSRYLILFARPLTTLVLELK